MLFGFIFPLSLGLLPYLLLFILKKKLPKYISEFTSATYNAGVATITFYSLFRGFLEIYGTNRDGHLMTYMVVSIILFSLAIIGLIVSIILEKKLRKEE